MFQELVNQPRPYDWGDYSAIATWQGREPSVTPEAELWFGTHPGSKARVKAFGAPEPIGLSEWLTQQGRSSSLPFLVKVLAAAQPLSIQVHPSKDQARVGFEAENAAGIEPDSPRRNYKDASDKPEMLIAWSETFDALVGFRNEQGRQSVIEALSASLDHGAAFSSLRTAADSGDEALARWLFSGADEVSEFAGMLTTRWREDPASLESLSALGFVVEHFPGYPGLLAACFLNHVTLHQGDALFIPAGIPHAYLRGHGLEVMAPSDNVLRGGLTSKHVDREELLRVIDSRPFTGGPIHPESDGHGRVFAPPGSPFVVTNLRGEGLSFPVDKEHLLIAVVESGEFEAVEGVQSTPMTQGSAWVGVTDQEAMIRGSGSLFVIQQA